MLLTFGVAYGIIIIENKKGENTMKALVIYFDTYLSIIDKLAKLNIVDIIWNENNFVIWYN